jgi:hypothetical protein
MGYGEKIKKILCPLNSLVRLRANTELGRVPSASRTSDPSIVNWLPQKDISYFSAFVNELDGA